MIRISPDDLLAVKANNRYYYAVILDRARLFGGNWTYVFHRTSEKLLPASELLNRGETGFHAFVDFIWAKRENRIERLAKKINSEPYNAVSFLKSTFTDMPYEKATSWYIYNLSFEELKRVRTLNFEEKSYPLFECINDIIMVERVDQRWTPEQDRRI